MVTPTLDKSIDCGTSACVQIKLSRNTWSDFLYTNIITADGVLTLTPYNIREYIDKVVRVRTPLGCENPDKPCATCDSQVLWAKDTSPPDLMKSHKRPTICHKLGTLKMLSMRIVNKDMFCHKPKPYKGVIVATQDDFKPEYYLKKQPTAASYVTRIILDTSVDMSVNYGLFCATKLHNIRCRILFEDILTLNSNKPNDRALAVYRAKSIGLWDDEMANPCHAILNLPGSIDVAIQRATEDGWWKDPNQKEPSVSDTVPTVSSVGGMSHSLTDIGNIAGKLITTNNTFKMKVVSTAVAGATVFEVDIEPHQIPPIGAHITTDQLIVESIIYHYEPEFSIEVCVR